MHVHGQLVKRRIPRLRPLRQHASSYRTGATAPDHVEHPNDEILHAGIPDASNRLSPTPRR